MPGKTAVPARIVIGGAGHLRLENEALLASEVAGVLEKIENLLPPFQNKTVAFTVLSPLAEEADRLVTRIILETSGTCSTQSGRMNAGLEKNSISASESGI
jgi:hypothetical protein